MLALFETLYFRNQALFYFGLVNLLLAGLFLLASRSSAKKVAGVNAWYKPVKFALSIGIFSWTMAWYTYYLPTSTITACYSWIIILMLGFEIIYISWQAGRGQLSHYNISTPLYSFLYLLMAMAATVVTLATAYIGLLFLNNTFSDLPDYYLWAIRISILLFVIFSLQGFMMGSRLAHTVGAPDGEEAKGLLNWSRKYGDLRIAHFLGMHALQGLPLLSFYILKSVWLTFLVSAGWLMITLYVLVNALRGKPLIELSHKQVKPVH